MKTGTYSTNFIDNYMQLNGAKRIESLNELLNNNPQILAEKFSENSVRVYKKK